MKTLFKILVTILLISCSPEGTPLYEFKAAILVTVQDTQTDTGRVLNIYNTMEVLNHSKGITIKEIETLKRIYVKGLTVSKNIEPGNITTMVTTQISHEIKQL